MGRSNEGRLYVGRLSHRTRERDLERLFSPFGRVREVLLKSGFAFVVSRILFLIVISTWIVVDKRQHEPRS